MNLRRMIARKIKDRAVSVQAFYSVLPVQTIFAADDPNCQSLLDSR